MQRYFLNESYHPQSTFSVGGETYHHMVRVMRMKPKDKVYLVFNDGVAVLGELMEITDQQVLIVERGKEASVKELPVQVTIACGLPKGDKLEWVVQKGTELGAHRFIGFPAKNSIVKWDHKKIGAKAKRLQKIAQEAAEQSHRQQVPEVVLLEEERQLIQQFEAYDNVLVAYEESAKQGERSALARTLAHLEAGSRLLIVFGPEGGFSPLELTRFEEHGALSCGLGPRILRAETAPLYALSAVSYQFELLG